MDALRCWSWEVNLMRTSKGSAMASATATAPKPAKGR
jgi:hypothetical protein